MIRQQDLVELIETLLAAVEAQGDLVSAAETLASPVAQSCAASLRAGDSLQTALQHSTDDAISGEILMLLDTEPRHAFALALTNWRLAAQRRQLWLHAVTYPCVSLGMVAVAGTVAQWWQHELAWAFLFLLIPAAVMIVLPLIGGGRLLPQSWQWRAPAQQAGYWRQAAAIAGRRLPEAALVRLFGSDQVKVILPLIREAKDAPMALALAEINDQQAQRNLRRCGMLSVAGIYLISASIILASSVGALQAGSQVAPTGLHVKELPIVLPRQEAEAD